ncbi:MAG TPA: response regulator transcription factor [Bryobacteraceae bacterium]|nr:response regulator transcription factor [Bryobacteraceae bacterium]
MTRVLILTDQPVLARGLQETLSASGIEVISAGDPALQAAEVLKSNQPELVLLDLTGEFTFETLADTHARMPACNLVIRVGPMSRELIFQALEYGVRGILPVQLSPEALVQSLERIANGEVLIEVTDAGFDSSGEKRVTFSEREKQVVELLAQGLKNKEIAAAMNLAEGTVKVYLSRLFKKTKVRDRFELMLFRAQDRKLLNNGDITGRTGNLPATAHAAPAIGKFIPSVELQTDALTTS